MAKCASTYLQHQAQEAAHANAQLSGDTPRYITPAGFFNAMKALDPLADRPTFIPYRERYAGP
ncbi:hypothetical protein CKO40_02060 [Halochromatium glycolicum]|uniref:Uncharacterized protein n=2 Tax=Halochromatium glycolicum TaxID=85075 RepID=A0AAJ0U165_9GAMM|nr:hypothetical protein [Halochromatium glycolicum]